MKRVILIVGSGVLVVLLAAAVGFRVAVAKLKDRIVIALGPGAELKELNVRWSSIELVALRVPAPKDWPAAQTFEAERVTLVPSLKSLLSNDVKIASIDI